MKKYGIVYIKLYPTCYEKILKSCKSVIEKMKAYLVNYC